MLFTAFVLCILRQFKLKTEVKQFTENFIEKLKTQIKFLAFPGWVSLIGF